MPLLLNKKLVFINSMKFMKSSLDKLVKNLSDSDFKYLIEESSLDKLVKNLSDGDFKYLVEEFDFKHLALLK